MSNSEHAFKIKQAINLYSQVIVMSQNWQSVDEVKARLIVEYAKDATELFGTTNQEKKVELNRIAERAGQVVPPDSVDSLRKRSEKLVLQLLYPKNGMLRNGLLMAIGAIIIAPILLSEFLPNKKTDSSHKPVWVEKLTHEPILPGVGVAGLRLGDSESLVLSKIGEPTTSVRQVIGNGREIFLDDTLGKVGSYVMNYDFEGLSLVIVTDADQKTVIKLRLMCFDIPSGNASKCRMLPSYKGDGIGTLYIASADLLGPTTNVESYSGCRNPIIPNTNDATMYLHAGIGFGVCRNTGVIEMVDIVPIGK